MAATRPLGPTALPGHWYGWQIMLADLGAIGLLVGGAALTSDVSNAYAFVPILGGVVYVFDAPIIESLQRNPERIPWTVGRRFLLPIALGAIGFGIGALAFPPKAYEDCTGTCAGGIGAWTGFAIGMLGAMIYDWVASSTPDRPALPQAATTGVVWAPVVVLGPRIQMAGVVLRF